MQQPQPSFHLQQTLQGASKVSEPHPQAHTVQILPGLNVSYFMHFPLRKFALFLPNAM